MCPTIVQIYSLGTLDLAIFIVKRGDTYYGEAEKKAKNERDVQRCHRSTAWGSVWSTHAVRKVW